MRALKRWIKGRPPYRSVMGAKTKVDANGDWHLEIGEGGGGAAAREITVCINGESGWFAKVAMGRPYQKDADGKQVYSEDVL